MESTIKEPASSSSSSGEKGTSRYSKSDKERDSSKAKEKTRQARDHPATTPGAVPSSSSSNRLERKKEKSRSDKRTSSTSGDKSGGRKSRSSSAASKPGAVSSSGRDRSKKGSSRSSGKSSHRPSSKASTSGSSTTRSSRVNEEKQVYLAANRPDRGPTVPPSANEMESGLVAEAVDDTELQTTSNALRDKNRENEALRQELQRTREEQASRRRRMSLWGKVCLGSLILIGAIVGAVIAFGGSDGEVATQAILIPTEQTTNDPTEQTTNDPTMQATTAAPTDSPINSPDGQSVFDPPSASTCSKISGGLPVDGQEDMTIELLIIKMNVYLLLDISKELWLPAMLQNSQQLLMPPVVGCGNTTLDLFPVGNAQVDQNNVTWVSCDDQTNGPCYTVEFPANLFMKKDVVSYDLDNLKQRVEGVFQEGTDSLVNAQDENSKAISDIQIVTSGPATSQQPSLQPSSNRLVTTDSPTTSPSLQPTMPLKSGATPSPTKLSTPSPTGPTLAPTSSPSLGPTLFPTSGPTLAPVPGLTPPPSPLPTPGPTAVPSPPPTPGPTISPTLGPSDSPSSQAPSTTPTIQPSVAPTTKCMRLEATLSRFAPFDGNKGQALDWLCSTDTWEPPIDPADETSLWEERFALAVFYYATTGDGWANNDGWLNAASVCSWHGIDGCNGDDSVTKIQLSDNGGSVGLIGDFPDEMRALTNAEHLDFARNRYLSGRIPSFLTSLTKLTDLQIGDTGRIGSIPSELWTLTKLQELKLWGNYLTGTIPSGIGAMTELRAFYAACNDFTGSLPDDLEGMAQLTALGLNENFLTGTIPSLPSSISSCNFAGEAWNGWHWTSRKTEGNCFTDTTNAVLCNLSANQCQLEATLSGFAPFDGNKALALDWLKADTWVPPSSATDETSQALWEERFALAVFYYATNGGGWSNNDGWLTSASVCSWSFIDGCNADGSVTKFYAGARLFTGSIPSELWALTNMQYLSFFGNYLAGTIPSGISAMTELHTLSFSYNDLTGSLPDEFGSMTQLTFLALQENFFDGTIPSLPSSLTMCSLAYEAVSGVFHQNRKSEGNCFTDTTNALGNCLLDANCS